MEPHLANIRRYLIDEATDKRWRAEPDKTLISWTNVYAEHMPTQDNCCDCGVFTLKCAEHLAAGLPLCFAQADMPRIRIEVERAIRRGFVE